MSLRNVDSCKARAALLEDAEGGAGDLRSQAREAFGVDAGADRIARKVVERDVGERVGAPSDEMEFYDLFQRFGHGLFADGEQMPHDFVAQWCDACGDQIRQAAACA